MTLRTDTPEGGSDVGSDVGSEGGSEGGSGPRAAQVARVAEAERWVVEAAVAPQRVVGPAEALAAAPGQPAEVRTVAWRAAALAARGLQQPSRAVELSRRAVAVAHRAGLGTREAEARLTLSLALFQAGRTVAAVRQLEQAATLAEGPLAVRVRVQEGILLERLGLVTEAIDAYGAALAEADAPDVRARILNNRAVARSLLGRYPAAFADFSAALALHEAAGADQAAAEVQHNIGFCAGLAGDLPQALAAFDRADARFRAAGVALGPNLVDRARTLLRANLIDEARRAAASAVAALDEAGHAADAAEARVLLARAQLLAGDAPGAAQTALLARGALRAQHRWWHAALADATLVDARVAHGAHDRRVLRQAEAAAEALGRLGLTLDELDCHLAAWRLARAVGDPERAARHLDAVRERVRRGALLERSRSWYAEAEHRRGAGDRAGALRAAAAGLHAVQRFQSLMGAMELRVGAAAHGRDLALLGLALTLERGDPWSVLRWVDAWRSASLSLAAPRRHDDPELDASLAELRAATRRVTDGPADDEDPTATWRAVATLEARVAQLVRHRQGAFDARPARWSAPVARQILGEGAFVSYFVDGDRFGAVRVVDGRARLVRALPASRSEVEDLVGDALFALRRLARPGRAAGSAAGGGALEAAERALGRLDEILLRPVLAATGPTVDPARPLVVSPTGVLHAVPWPALASCWARQVAVAPSLAAVRPPANRLKQAPSGPVVLVAGPGLPGAEAEVDRVAQVYAQARTFHPGRSVVSDVVAAIEGASLAHFACHGRLRVDNPLFSSLELADGPLTVHDIDRLELAPAVVVLAACAVGTSAVRAGDELLGFGSALLRAGTRTVVASLLPVPDEAAADVMVGLHGHLAAGLTPADALARCRAELDDAPLSLALRAAFTSVGAP